MRVWLPNHSSESGLTEGSESCSNPAWLCVFFPLSPLSFFENHQNVPTEKKDQILEEEEGKKAQL